MQVETGKVVAIEYCLKDDEGNVIDQSGDGEPLVYLHGYNNIIPGLENALENKETGTEVEVVVPPVEGYGEHQLTLEQKVPKDRFQGVENLEVGMRFQASTNQGPVSVRITEIEDEEVTVDGNHPLAGKNLNFDVKVSEVRDARPDELEQGKPQTDTGN